MTDQPWRRSLRALALTISVGAAVVPGAAQAQLFGWGGWDDGGSWDGLGPRQVRRAISDRGFRVIAPLRRNGNVYVADVLDPSGQRERLIVAAADASILSRFLVDDGRGPTRNGPGRGFASGGDDGAPVPPADIPGVERRAPRVVEPPAPRFGDLDSGEGAGGGPRAQPPVRTVRPRPRVVERAPEAPASGREPGPVESSPLAPVAPRPSPPPAAPAPSAPVAKAPATTRPEPAPAAPTTAPAPPAPATPAAPAVARRPSDPLAIPGTGEPRTVRSVANGITGAPQPAAAPAQPAAPAKAATQPAVVPVAPLD